MLKLIKAVVMPSPEEVAAAKRALEKHQAVHAAKLERRRKRRREKNQGQDFESDSDDEGDNRDMDTSPPKGARKEVDFAGTQNVLAQNPPFVGPEATGTRPKVPMPRGNKDAMDTMLGDVTDMPQSDTPTKATMRVENVSSSVPC